MSPVSSKLMFPYSSLSTTELLLEFALVPANGRGGGCRIWRPMPSPSSTRVPASASNGEIPCRPSRAVQERKSASFPAVVHPAPHWMTWIDLVPFQEAHQPREMVRVGVGEDYQVNRMLPVWQTLAQF